MSYDFIAVLDVYARFLLIGFILRYIISFLPASLKDIFEEPALFIRYQLIEFFESLWTDRKQFEVVFLTRIMGPFAFLVFVQAFFFNDGQYLQFINQYPTLKIIIFLINIFIFINVAPEPEDFGLLWETENNSKLFFMAKISLLITFAMPKFLIAGLFIFPILGNSLNNGIEQDWSE